MRKETTIQAVIEYVKEKLYSTESGHDYWHALRVLKNARRIADDYTEINLLLLETSALIHDIIDHKFEDSKIASVNSIADFLKGLNFSKADIDFVFL